MIHFTLRERDGEITGFSCKGHAGYAQAGSDIVCAAVSCLTQTCANALETVAGVRAAIQIGDGKMELLLPPDAGHDAQVILLFLRQGMADLAEAYPQYLQLNLAQETKNGRKRSC